MAIWVCRTGQNGQYENIFFENNCICLTREGFDFDLKLSDKDCILSRIIELNPNAAKQTISNTWSQIDIFVNRMKSGDVVIIPKKNSSNISIAIIAGGYVFAETVPFPMIHTRRIKLLKKDIVTTSFPKDIRYSLGAFRTIFGIRQESQLLNELRNAGVKIDEI